MHFFARTKLMSELRWLSYWKTKTKIIETNALMVWSSSVESHLRKDNLPPAASHSSFINKSNPLTGTGLNKFVSSLLEPPPTLSPILLHKHRSTKWNNLLQQCILSSTCFGYIRPSSGALDVELQHMVFCTEFLDGWWSWEPLRRSCVASSWHFKLFH